MFGLSKWLVSDGDSHFDNELLDELTELLGIDHHTTLANQIRKVGVTLPLKSDLRSIEN